uniref:Uncharacterized protein n=1 Tax=Anguilla anguilla TaxID=7936 RepID=A0A0E9Q459_ANGAN
MPGPVLSVLLFFRLTLPIFTAFTVFTSLSGFRLDGELEALATEGDNPLSAD